MIFGSLSGPTFGANILENWILERMPEPLVSQGGPKMVQRWPKAPKLSETGAKRYVLFCLLDDLLCILRSMLLSGSLLVLLAAFF